MAFFLEELLSMLTLTPHGPDRDLRWLKNELGFVEVEDEWIDDEVEVQNADDNNYQENVEPTLVFIVHSERIVILNNELGFSDKNIRALCDVGNSTKKGSTGGYIGQKGIGFKSVFRITDAPEIHSNGFHVKFDITEGQIGFVLPTIIPPCDVGYYTSVINNSDQSDSTAWNTCIVLPFKLGLKQGKGHSSIISMFSDLHPSLLLFLHRLNCIVFKSIIEGKLIIMRRKVLSDGIVMVSQGAEKLCWLVVSKSLEASLVRPDVQTTKIAMAFPLEQSGNGDYVPLLDQQPVFAFLPLRKYGLKFIIQGDFVLPSSREEVDEDSAWNQWLLSEMPDLFVLAEKSFCALSCFKDNPAKAITTFMSFVPLVGEVHGFFSPLPRMILSKLRMSNCLLGEGSTVERAPPFALLRNWSKDLQTFLTEDLLLQHLGLSYLHKDIRLSDTLARAMGVQEFGPRTLIGLLSSICHGNGINVLGLEWISSWLKAFHVTLSDNSSGHLSSGNADIKPDLFDSLGKIPFIPLSDGSYSSLEKGPIWFPCNIFNMGSQDENVFGNLPGLLAELRTVNSLLFSSSMTPAIKESSAAIVVKVLERIGVQKLSAHDVIRSHIFPSIYDGKTVNKNMDLTIEYLIYVLFHLQSSCVVCKTERGEIVHGLKKNFTLLTNHGSICPTVEPIHFGEEFGNAFNVKELVDNMNIKWNEVDTIYLKHPSSLSLSLGLMTWREFFQELGVTDFVQVNQVQRNIGVYAFSHLKCSPCYQDATSVDMLVNDWESPEMISILSSLSSNKCLQKSRYLLEILDKMWDDSFSAKARCQSLFLANEQKEPLQSSFMKCIVNFKWVACSIDEEVHYPKDLFYDCELVHSLLGAGAPYAAPLVTSKRLVEDIGFKVTVTLDDALKVLQSWRTTDYTVASVSQMSKFYTYISEELGKSDEKIIKKVKEDVSIFIPFSYNLDHMDVVSGAFMLPHQLYWHDPTGCLNRIREAGTSYIFANEGDYTPSITLDVLYSELHDFLVNVCGVYETPPSCHYFQILFHLSSIALPSEVALLVFKLMVKWSNDLNSGVCQDEDVLELKEKLLKPESTVLPTVQDKWVSLHPCFGSIYWSDDEKLINEYAHLSNINFLNFGKLDEGEKELLNGQVAILLKKIGIPELAEVVSREAIFYGVADATKEAFLINWILPYAQRYLYKQHADIYFKLKESGFLRIMQLQVILVEKLYYRNTLQGNSSTKQKRYECRSLLEETRLYTTPHADAHTMFLELSRLFFEGTPDLQMANFLYIVAKEFGSAEDEVESLVVNNLEVPLLPKGETIWSLDGSHKLNPEVSSTQAASVYKRQYPTPRKKTSAKLNWPPTKESTLSSNAVHLKIPNEKQSVDASAGDGLTPTEADGMIPTSSEENKSNAYKSVRSLLQSATEDISSSSMQVNRFPTPSLSATNDVSSGSMLVESLPTSVSYLHEETLLEFKNRDRLLLEAPEEEQSYKTGRLGEMVAYKFFCHKLGQASVRWINEKSEMGLPYDLVVEEEIATRYVEVKATSSATKDWFSISTNEWNCASEKGESYSIAWVILSSQSDAQVHVFNNPLKLCQQKLLQLAILLPKGSPNSLQF
ncbi:hypothetical protein HPP92_003865 [Vanilla planifolia]|uniref:Protein NO VEIN C-terminal domain-containing protein n=1 Tax=Vanilla planifolia TaxID=51239 RepID=A0A835RVX2_VANPL|nr:hypothetical protein HPP92_003865 [Vanilla planifolia]